MGTQRFLMKSFQSLVVLSVFVSSFGFFSTLAQATETVSQSVTLSQGWNIISTPKVLESHAFSVAETSVNFDIFVLDASKTAGWSTMADLGQTEFTPLYGYFVNNKTNAEQTLTLNYDTTLEPNEKLFERTFPTAGWYSIGVANDEYAKNQNADRDDTNNPSRILSLLEGKYDLVIDFNDAQYDSSRRSVAIADPWKASVPVDIDQLNDFRETKGYAVYLKEDNATYTGFQNDAVNEPIIAKLSIGTSINDPDSTTLELDDSTLSDEFTVFAFSLNTENSTEDITITRVEITADGTTEINNYVNDATLVMNEIVISQNVTITPTSIVFEFADGDFVIERGEQIEVELSVVFNALTPDHEGDSVQFSIASSNVNSRADEIILATGSASGGAHTLRIAGVDVSAGTISSVVTVVDGTASTGPDYATYKIQFEVTAFGQDVYVSTNPSVSTSYTLEDGSGVAAVAGTRTATLSSTGSQVGTSFEITEGSTETITLEVTYVPGAANTAARLNFNTLTFGSTSGTPTGQTWTASPDENYRTAVVTIVN